MDASAEMEEKRIKIAERRLDSEERDHFNDRALVLRRIELEE